MAKKVYVTRVQKDAAKLLVSRSAVTGRYVSSNVRKIANAQSSVPDKATPHPRTTVDGKK
jgi:hypothetical protein